MASGFLKIDGRITREASVLDLVEASAPGNTASIGKFYASSGDNKPHFVSSGGTDYDLSVGVPAGSDGQIQYNNGGVAGGDSDLAWNDSTKKLTVGNGGNTVGVYHDGTDGHIDTSTGDLYLSPNGAAVVSVSSDLSVTGDVLANAAITLVSGGTINSTSNGNINIAPNGTGILTLASDVQLTGGGNITNGTVTSLTIPATEVGVVIGSGTADPTGVNGQIYYKSDTHAFRAKVNGAWTDLSATQLSALSDVGVTTATAGRLLVADGDSWESQAISGAIAFDGTGATSFSSASFASAADTDVMLMLDASESSYKRITKANFLNGYGVMEGYSDWGYLDTNGPTGSGGPNLVYQFDNTATQLNDRVAGTYNLTAQSTYLDIPFTVIGRTKAIRGASRTTSLSDAERPTGAATAEFVGIITGDSGSEQYIFGISATGESLATNTLFSLYTNATGQLYIFAEYGTGTNIIEAFDVNVPLNVPVYIALTRDSAGTGYSLYINGVLMDTLTAANAPQKDSSGNVQNLGVLCDGSGFSYTSPGMASSFRLTVGEEFTQTQITEVWNSIAVSLGDIPSFSLSDLSDVGVTTGTAGRVLIADGDSWESQAISGAIALDGTGATTFNATAETTANDADLVLIYDDSAADYRRMTRANFLSGISLDTAYNSGYEITVDGNPVTLTVPYGANNAGLLIDQNDSLNDPAALIIDNAGTGAAIDLQGVGRKITSASSNLTIETTTVGSIYVTAASAVNISAGTNTDIDSSLSVSGNILLTSGGILQTSSNGNLVLQPNGTGTTRIGGGSPSIITTAGDLFITGALEIGTTLWLASGGTIGTSSNGDINLNPNGTGIVSVGAELQGSVIQATTLTTSSNGDLTISPDGTGVIVASSDLELSGDLFFDTGVYISGTATVLSFTDTIVGTVTLSDLYNSGADQLSDLTDVSSSTATSGNILIANGSTFASQDVDGAITLSSTGATAFTSTTSTAGNDADLLLIYDSSVPGYRRITRANFVSDIYYPPGGSSGHIQYYDGSGFAGESNLYWDSTNKRVGIGTDSPSAGLTLVADDVVNCAIYIESSVSATTSPLISCRKARGTPSSKADVVSGDEIGTFYASPWVSSAYRVGGYLVFKADTVGATWASQDMIINLPTTNGFVNEIVRFTHEKRLGIATDSPGGTIGIKASDTYIDRDGSGNMTFTDAIGSTWTLTELATSGVDSLIQCPEVSDATATTGNILIANGSTYAAQSFSGAISLSSTGVTAFTSTESTSAADADLVLIYDDSEPGYRRITRANFLTGVASNPGGSSNNIQYNSSGSFGGISYLNVDTANTAIVLGDATAAPWAQQGMFVSANTDHAYLGLTSASAGNTAVLSGYTVGGTHSSPTATTSGRALFQIQAGGLRGSSWSTNKAVGGVISFVAAANYATNPSTDINLWSIQDGSSSGANRYTIDGNTGDHLWYGNGASPSNYMTLTGDGTLEVTQCNIEQSSAGTTWTDLPKHNIYAYGTNSLAQGYLRFVKANGSAGTPTAVTNGDYLGQVLFGGFYATGSELTQGSAFISARAKENWSSGNYGTELVFATTPNTTSSYVVRMRLTQEGYLALGTESPVTQIHAVGTTYETSSQRLSRYSNDNGPAYFVFDKARGSESSPSAILNGDYIGQIQWSGYDGSTQNGGAIIRSKATENWSGTGKGNELHFYNCANGSTTNQLSLKIEQDGVLWIPFCYGNTASGGTALYINSSGELGTGTSSLRYKKDIEDVGNIDWLYELGVKKFKFIDQTDDVPCYGFIAEEVHELDPSLVIYEKDGEQRPHGLMYERFIPLAVRGIQENKSRYDTLKEEYDQLKLRVEQLETEMAEIRA